MRLSDNQINIIKANAMNNVSESDTWENETVVNLIDTIEALQQENEQLKNENTSIRNWNACEEELYNELLESDKRRWELESELEDASNYRAGLEAIIKKLREQVKTYVEAKIQDYHIPADVEALKQAGEALEQTKGFIKGIGCYCNCEGEYASQCQPCFIVEQIDKALTAIDKAIGGKEDE